MVVRIIQLISCALIAGALGFQLAVLGYYFPEGKDIKGSIKKAKKNKKITFLTIFFASLLSGIAGFFADSVIYAVICCFLTCALCVIFTVDFRTYEIPFRVNVFIFTLGVIRAIFSIEDIWLYVIGFFVVSLPLAIMFYASKGRAIGFGDVKMMAACGLLIGWKCAILALFIGCVVGSVVHLIRMKVHGEGAVLAMGPYLAIGVYIAAVWGEKIISAYISLIRI